MPQLSAEQQDAIDEAIDRQLFRINKITSRVFGQELSDQEKVDKFGTLKSAALQSMRERQAPASAPSPAPAPSTASAPRPPPRMVNVGGQLVPEYAIEGGDIADSSGIHTEQIRRGLR